ncbi:helix-turn-helix domain-containing protein [Trueperella pyogenes]
MTKDELRDFYEADLAAYGPTLKPQQIAEYLEISRTAVYALLKDGDIPSFRIGVKYYVSKNVFIEHLLSGYPKPSE